jgi:PPOX class probable F420-dependent enzyme
MEEGTMSDVLQQDETSRRLSSESVAWLTTVGADGQPQSSPVWFYWDGSSLWLRSQAHAGKVRNIGANPRVAVHLGDDGQGGNIVTIEGRASFEDAPQELPETYLSKYDHAIRTELKTTPEQLAADYPTTIRITPTRARVW